MLTKKIFLCFLLLLTIAKLTNAQNVGINNPTPAASALLDLTATNKGLLIPRMTTAQRIAISLPASGLLVYDVTLIQFYYFDGTIWRPLLDNKIGWNILGNSGTVDGTNFIGTVDNVPFNLRVNNQKAGRIDNLKANTFLGYQAGNSLTTGFGNAALGHHALFSNTSGYRNVAIGDSVMRMNTTGYNNTANGFQSLYSNTTGYENVANGASALYFNTTGNNNTAIGHVAMFLNTTGYQNTANGSVALYTNTIGYANTANGFGALYQNTTGNNNTATGSGSLFINSTGSQNTATGQSALSSNSSGWNNVAIGLNALYSNTTGYSNTALGVKAGYVNTTGTRITLLGDSADVTTNLTNATALGWNAKVAQSNSIVLGSINGINGATVTVNVGIGTTTPAQRFHVSGNDGIVRVGSMATGGNNITNPTATTDKLMYADANGDLRAIANGTNGQTLSINGSGVPAWTSPATVAAWNLAGNTGTTVPTSVVGTPINNNFIGTTDNKDFVLAANNKERLRMDGDNYLIGIGQANPQYAVDMTVSLDAVNPCARNGIRILQPSYPATCNNGLFLGIENNNADQNMLWALGNIGTAYMRFGFGNPTNSGTEVMRLVQNAVEINTPVNKEAVLNLMDISATKMNGIMVSNSANAPGTRGTLFGLGVGGVSDDASIWNYRNNAVIFGTNNTERVRIDAGGNVGIGTATPARALHVAGAFSGARIGGLGTLGSFIIAPSINTDKLVYANANGDLQAIANGASGQTLTINGSGVPAWTNPATGNDWTTTGNSGTVDGTNFIGTTDNVPFNIRVNNQKAGRITMGGLFGGETFFGYQAGLNNTYPNSVGIGYKALYSNTGVSNTAIGTWAMYSNSSGSLNTAIGFSALGGNTTGSNNTATGHHSLVGNSSGSFNTANGQSALYSNSTGSSNTANGYLALYSNTSGNYNAANGVYALYANSIGNNNSAYGYQSLYSNTTGNYNVGNGTKALYTNTTGNENTATGTESLFANTTGNYNVANGSASLYSNTTGNDNTANGHLSLSFNTTGNYNVANGAYALASNTTGNNNTANGTSALYNNSTGHNNSSNGYQSLYLNTTGYFNVANGTEALYSNTTGYVNTANGYKSLYSNTTGSNNAGTGSYSLYSNTSGSSNTANGFNSLYSNSSGFANSALGYEALYSHTTGSGSSALGYQSLRISTGNNNTGIGTYAGNAITTGANNTAVGYNAQVPTATASNQIRMGDASVSYAGIQVNWTTTSDLRWKEQVRDIPYGLDFITKLRPVDYIRKVTEENKNGFNSGTREAGFIAQEVEATLKEAGYQTSGMITKDDKGYYGMRYDDLFSILVKSVQELSKQNDDQKKQIEELKSADTSNDEVNSNPQAKNPNLPLQKSTALYQNQPHPFNQPTVIRYASSIEHSNGAIVIRDLGGNTVKSIAINNFGKGQVTVNANELAQGTYTYTLEIADESMDTKLMVITK